MRTTSAGPSMFWRMEPSAYHEEGGVICVGGASGGTYVLNTQRTHRRETKGRGYVIKGAGLKAKSTSNDVRGRGAISVYPFLCLTSVSVRDVVGL